MYCIPAAAFLLVGGAHFFSLPEKLPELTSTLSRNDVFRVTYKVPGNDKAVDEAVHESRGDQRL
jgi:hypothetical protein